MELIKLSIKGLILLKPKVFHDNRGMFFESYNYDEFKKNGINISFVQDNQSKSKKNVLRGLHFQKPPYEQAKLIRVIKGSVLDIAVDIRHNSPTYGKWEKHLLSEDNQMMFFIPDGFAHGFLSLEDDTIVSYKCSNIYNKASEDTIVWNDPIINIDWGINNPILSEKDKTAQLFDSFISPFQ